MHGLKRWWSQAIVLTEWVGEGINQLVNVYYVSMKCIVNTFESLSLPYNYKELLLSNLKREENLCAYRWERRKFFHNHPIHAAHTLSFHPINEPTKLQVFDLFDKGQAYAWANAYSQFSILRLMLRNKQHYLTVLVIPMFKTYVGYL